MNAHPLVLCLTNTVAANYTANLLLAFGAVPAMMEEPEEAAALAAAADALLVNVGTVTRAQAETMRAAIASAKAHGKPWVLDPVAVHLLKFREGLAREFLAEGPTLVRGNRAECDFLFPADAPVPCPVLATAETDLIRAPGLAEPLAVTGGTPILQTVTATGCSQGALAAALLGQGLAPLDAARTASRLMKRAGERAASRTSAPGSFQIALLDALHELSLNPQLATRNPQPATFP